MQLGKGKSIKAKTYGSDEDFIRLKKIDDEQTEWKMFCHTLIVYMPFLIEFLKNTIT